MINEAIRLHSDGHLDKAEQLYQAILSARPEDSEATHYLGILLHQRDRSDTGLALILHSVEQQPGRADWLNDLGNVLTEREQLNEAAGAFLRAADVEPTDPNLWNNLGAVLAKLNRSDDAGAAYQQALDLDPQFVSALTNMGELQARMGNIADAAQYHCRAFVLGPQDGKSKRMLGIAYYALNRVSEAAEAYRTWAEEEPENPVARHMLAACSGQNVPARAADGFVEFIFDEYAANFDEKLVGGLAYRGPEYIAQALAAIITPAKSLTVLDAGCGTGLCGKVAAPYARHLTGVDLSANMLARAAEGGYYDALEKVEIGTYLEQHPRNFDLIISADVLIYFGALDDVVSALSEALQPSGHLVFTFETLEPLTDEPPFAIVPSGRFRHNYHYVSRVLEAHGFRILAATKVALREEFKQPVAGMVVTAHQSADDKELHRQPFGRNAERND